MLAAVTVNIAGAASFNLDIQAKEALKEDTRYAWARYEHDAVHLLHWNTQRDWKKQHLHEASNLPKDANYVAVYLKIPKYNRPKWARDTKRYLYVIDRRGDKNVHLKFTKTFSDTFKLTPQKNVKNNVSKKNIDLKAKGGTKKVGIWEG